MLGVMDTLPQPSPLYPRDAYAWSLQQVAVLERLRTAGLALPNDLDLDNIIEEIASVGSEAVHAVESNLIQALLHLLKLALLPDAEPARHWRKEIRAFLLNAARRCRPSMRQALDLDDLWKEAGKRAADDFELMDAALPILPAGCPLDLGALVDEAADPRVLASDLAAALARPA